MALQIFDNGVHRIIRFDDLAGEGDVQANQYLVIHGGRAIVLEPGGNRMFSSLIAAISSYVPPQKIDYILVSHQDPDVAAGLNGYLLVTDAKFIMPKIWERFIPTFCSKGIAQSRIIPIPDRGMRFTWQGVEFLLLPAHFLHSSGNIHVYDPVSKSLFSSDLGAAIFPPGVEGYPIVEDFDAHIQYMEPFHRRYMPSKAVCRAWAQMVWLLDIERIVPQHGAIFEGKEMVKRFIEWVTTLDCGVERLIADGIYTIPE